MRIFGIVLCVLVCVGVMFGQQQQPQPRVFVTDSQSWEMTGAAGGSRGAFAAGAGGGARPQTAEIVKTFGQNCKRVVINNQREKADYTVVLDHEGGKGWIRKDNKVAVFDSNGDAILSRSTRSLGNAVSDACGAIKKDWATKGRKRAEAKTEADTAAAPAVAPAPAVAAAPAVNPAPELMGGKFSISSSPAGADIEIDGAFVGSTPSAVTLKPGEYSVVIKKTGFKNWERKLKVTGGEVSLVAELEKTS